MYNIALVQNQSEMSHYSYADARSFFQKNLEYRLFLYTAQNISMLTNDISRGHIDSVVLASHATNDITICNVIFSDEFATALKLIFKRHGGILILHQLRLGEKALLDESYGKLSFLSERTSQLTAMARNTGESPLLGNIGSCSSDSMEYLLNFPNKIDISKVISQCQNNIGLKGLYWHYWTNVDSGEWDVILQDDSTQNSRPLVLCTKQRSMERIVVSSLTVDWQKQFELMENLINYTVEGRHHVAYLMSSKDTGIDVRYFSEKLKSKRIALTIYKIPNDKNTLNRVIENDIHSIYILTEEAEKNISVEQKNILEKKKEDGYLKIISIKNGEFTVAGREHDELRILYTLEIEAIKDLMDGYIDGSYWSTVESLQVFDSMKYHKVNLSQEIMQVVLRKISTHDRNGSYDGVFGATCALLWIRAKYLGLKHEDTKKTLEWLHECYEMYDYQSQIHYLLTLLKTKCYTRTTKKEIEDNISILLQQTDFSMLTEINMVTYLEAANVLNKIDIIKRLIDRLNDLQCDGIWIDVATTASIVTNLLLAREVVLIDENYKITKLDTILFMAVTAIQKAANPMEYDLHPWDRKISINLKCINALLSFDNLIDLPITEIIDSIDIYSKNNADDIASITALTILSDFSVEFSKMKQDKKLLEDKLKQREIDWIKYKRALISSWFASFICSITVYLIIMLILFIREIQISSEEYMSFVDFIFDKTEITLAYIGVISGIIIAAFPKKIFQKNYT